MVLNWNIMDINVNYRNCEKTYCEINDQRRLIHRKQYSIKNKITSRMPQIHQFRTW